MATADNYENLKLIISEWASKGTLDNSIIEMLWQYFTKKLPVSNEFSCAALHLIGMAALGRRTIISRNVEVISKIVFESADSSQPAPGLNDLHLTRAACDVLALIGLEKQNITDRKPACTIDPEDQIWQNLFGILHANFKKPGHFYNKALSSAINFLFKVSFAHCKSK